MAGWIPITVVLLLIVLVVVLYNRLIVLRNRVKNAFAQIDVQLTRRHDLIPNLVETVKGYIKHERETLEAVIQARNTAVASLKAAAADPSRGEAVRQLGGAEGALSGALGRLLAVAEAYPDLKANQNMMQLSEELTSTENRVAYARQSYNDSVMDYNNARETLPNSIVAGAFRFTPATMLEIEDVAKRAVPKVSF
ncbi:MAG TPA: LemA family protein [Burkholderiales bacterium]|jgi:LemA protein|nr:LemA family protein [Burkholderiales bacterium]